MADERLVHTNGVDLCVQTFGDRADPTILLIMGAGASMLYWDVEFCQRLADAGRFVVRYDYRDTGRSTSYQPGAPPYSIRDLLNDAVGLLDAYQASRAHIVGMSLGASLGQLMALDHPERVASLTLMSSTPEDGHDHNDLPGLTEELPAMADELRTAFGHEPAEPDWSNRAAVIEYIVAAERPYAGAHGFDDEYWRDLAGRVFDRTVNMAASTTNHFLLDDPEPWRHRLATLDVPTLVLHGTDDPLFPYEHGRALAREIPGAELIAMNRTGHEPPPRHVWDVVLPAIIRHTSTA